MSYLSRRAVLKGGTAYLLDTALASAQSPNANFFKALQTIPGVEFVAQGDNGTISGTGRDVPRTLANLLNGKPFTANFGFKECGAICPATNEALKHLSNTARANGIKDLTSVIISVHPQDDIQANPTYIEKMRQTYGVSQKLIILYPKRNGQYLDNKTGEDLMGTLAKEMGVRNKPTLHAMDIFLYDGRGNHLDQQNGMLDPHIFDRWVPVMKNAMGR